MGEETREDFDAIPEILQTDVLVGGVLIIVVVRDWQTDHWRVVRLLKKIHRDAAACGREKDRLVSGLRHDVRDFQRERKIERGPARRITTAPYDFHNLGVLQSGGGIRSFT